MRECPCAESPAAMNRRGPGERRHPYQAGNRDAQPPQEHPMKSITTSKIAIGMATAAMFAAAGGPAQAVSLISDEQVKNGSLTGRDIRSNSITGTDVRDIRGRDVRDGSLTAADFA